MRIEGISGGKVYIIQREDEFSNIYSSNSLRYFRGRENNI